MKCHQETSFHHLIGSPRCCDKHAKLCRQRGCVKQLRNASWQRSWTSATVGAGPEIELLGGWGFQPTPKIEDSTHVVVSWRELEFQRNKKRKTSQIFPNDQNSIGFPTWDLFQRTENQWPGQWSRRWGQDAELPWLASR